MEDQDLSHVGPCGIIVGQSGNGTAFLLST